MNKLLTAPLTSLLLTAALTCAGQGFQVKLSLEHVQKIEELKSPALKIKKYKKYYSRDSIRFLKNLEKRYRKKSDSILTATRASIFHSEEMLQNKLKGIVTKANTLEQQIEKLKSPALDIKKYKKYYSRDSIRILKNIEKGYGKKSESILGATQSDILHAQERLQNNIKGIVTKVNSLYEPLLPQSFEPVPFKNEAEQFHPGYYQWRRDLGRWYLSSGYYKPDSTGINLVGFTTLVQNGMRLPQGVPGVKGVGGPDGLPDRMPNVDGTLNAYEGKEKSQALSQLSGMEGLKEAKQLQGEAGTYSKELSQYQDQYGKYIHNPDSIGSMVTTNGAAMAEKAMESRVSGMSDMKQFQGHQKELAEAKGLQQQYMGQVNQLRDSAYIKKQVKEKAEQMAMTYLNEHPAIMNEVQKKMSRLMRTYSIVPNSNDLSTATKRTSLRGRTFRERLVVASNFQKISRRPFAIDFSPLVGYKINSLFAVGIGGMYRQAFKDSLPRLAPQVLGYKAFTSYDWVKSFFGYAEFGRNSPGMSFQNEHSSRIWKNALIAGVGKKFLVHKKVEMTMLVAYQFFHQPNDPVYPRPLIVRVGFQLSELALLKRKVYLPR